MSKSKNEISIPNKEETALIKPGASQRVFGIGVEQEDLIIPRAKLIQAMSPESSADAGGVVTGAVISAAPAGSANPVADKNPASSQPLPRVHVCIMLSSGQLQYCLPQQAETSAYGFRIIRSCRARLGASGIAQTSRT